MVANWTVSITIEENKKKLRPEWAENTPARVAGRLDNET